MRQSCALCLGRSLGIQDWNLTRGGGVAGDSEGECPGLKVKTGALLAKERFCSAGS